MNLKVLPPLLRLIALTGCKENPQDYRGIVPGEIIGTNGFNLERSIFGPEIGISIGQYPLEIPDYYGRFHFDDIFPPYDILVFRDIRNPPSSRSIDSLR